MKVYGAIFLSLCINTLVWGQAGESRGMKMRVCELLGEDAAIPRYYALVIGINEYQHWQDLRQARPDAEEIAGLLRHRYAFNEVTTLVDDEATRVNITRQLRALAGDLKETDALLVFYAGHGHFDKLLNRGYWVPHEAREQVDGVPATTEWFSNNELNDYIAALRARHVLIVSDSCFSGSLFRGGAPDLTEKENAWYRRALQQPSRWGISSGDLEYVPDQSVFTRQFLNALQYPLKPVFAASDLAIRIRGEVAETTGTQPLFGRLQGARDSQFGEFVFIDVGTGAAESPSSAPRAIQASSRVSESPANINTASPSSPTEWAEVFGAEPSSVVASVPPPDAPEMVVAPPVVKSPSPSVVPSPPSTRFAPPTPSTPSASATPRVIDLGGGVNMALVWIPPGSFTMGGDQAPEVVAREGGGKSSCFRDEQPPHQVTITKGFWLGQHEVTQEQWQALMGSNPSRFKATRKPVEQVSWTDCQEFISRLNSSVEAGGFRLPTEAEWEYACRAGTTTPFHYGYDLDAVMANFDGGGPYGSGGKAGSRKETVPVGLFSPNDWGLYDMHGNVWEWCQDAKRNYTTEPVTDPEGVDRAQTRALRGGSWRDPARNCRSAYRNAFQPGMRDLSIGFRIVAH